MITDALRLHDDVHGWGAGRRLRRWPVEGRGPDPAAAGTSQAAALVSGTFALLRGRFPHDSARRLVTRALYNVHNGLGASNVGHRIDDTLGYGQILPYFALTTSPPAGFANPIYDRFARALAPPASTSPVAPTSTPGGAASSPARSAPAGGGGVSGGVIAIVVAAAALVVGGAIGAVRLRSRRT